MIPILGGWYVVALPDDADKAIRHYFRRLSDDAVCGAPFAFMFRFPEGEPDVCAECQQKFNEEVLTSAVPTP